MKKKKKIIILSILVVLVVGWIAFCGYLWAWGPFHKLHDIKTGSLPGNASEYALENVHKKQIVLYKGKILFFLAHLSHMVLLQKAFLLLTILRSEMETP